jgi:hypothetical protein
LLGGTGGRPHSPAVCDGGLTGLYFFLCASVSDYKCLGFLLFRVCALGVGILGKESPACGHIRPCLVQDMYVLEEAANRIERFVESL